MSFTRDPTFPNEQALGEENLPLTSRNLQQNPTDGGWPSASSDWVDRERESGKRQKRQRARESKQEEKEHNTMQVPNRDV